MMGYSYYGNTLMDQHRYERKFAWLPVRSGSKKHIWLTHYYVRHTYYDQMGKPPIHGLSWQYIYTKNEYLIEMITDPPTKV